MKKNLKKIVSVVLAVIMVMSLIPTMASAASSLGKIDGIDVRAKVELSIGGTYNLSKPKSAKYLDAVWYGDNYGCVETIYNDEWDVAQKLLGKNEGVTLVLVTAFNRILDEYRNWYDDKIIERYWLIVVVKPYGKTVNDMGRVKSAYMDDITVDYKDDFYLFPMVETNNDNYTYFCTYFVSDPEGSVTVYDDGSFFAYEIGSTDVTCYVIDAQGKIFTSDFTFTVKYTPKQWIVKYLLFGWLWEFISNIIYF